MLSCLECGVVTGTAGVFCFADTVEPGMLGTSLVQLELEVLRRSGSSECITVIFQGGAKR